MKIFSTTIGLISVVLPLFLVTASCKKEEPAVEQKPVTTLAEISTDGVSSIAQNEATFEATVINEGASAVGIRGFCWGNKPNPTVSDNFSQNEFGPGSYTHRATGLSKNTKYYVRSYATNANGTVYGNELSFTTVNEYKVGDTGPAGGIVFYVDGSGGGMEAAPESTEKTAIWGCFGKTVFQTGTNIGSGKSNTQNILVDCGVPNIAADICDKLEINGYDDWFLPSLQELGTIYTEVKNPGGFTNDYYWTSSQSSATAAYCIDMSAGGGGGELKSEQYKVRAVRSF